MDLLWTFYISLNQDISFLAIGRAGLRCVQGMPHIKVTIYKLFHSQDCFNKLSCQFIPVSYLSQTGLYWFDPRNATPFNQKFSSPYFYDYQKQGSRKSKSCETVFISFLSIKMGEKTRTGRWLQSLEILVGIEQCFQTKVPVNPQAPSRTFKGSE